MATPILADIRKYYPEAKITAMCQSNVAFLIAHDPNVDEIFCCPKPKGWIYPSTIIEKIREGQYDLGILLTNSLSSAWWFWKGHVKNRIGYAGNLRSWLLDKTVSFPPERETQHLVITYKMLLEPLGIPVTNTSTALYSTNEEIQKAQNLLSQHGINLEKNTLIGINPGAAYGSAKCWLPERFVQVSQRLLEANDTYLIYFGDSNGAPLVNQICEQLPERVINLAGKTSLRELMAFIKSCSAFLTNDSGPMHIAAALGTPLIALFGSTNEVKTGPYPRGKVIHKHVKCSPCYKRVCPIDFPCMKNIEVDEVFAELNKVREEGGQDNSA